MTTRRRKSILIDVQAEGEGKSATSGPVVEEKETRRAAAEDDDGASTASTVATVESVSRFSKVSEWRKQVMKQQENAYINTVFEVILCASCLVSLYQIHFRLVEHEVHNFGPDQFFHWALSYGLFALASGLGAVHYATKDPTVIKLHTVAVKLTSTVGLAALFLALVPLLRFADLECRLSNCASGIAVAMDNGSIMMALSGLAFVASLVNFDNTMVEGITPYPIIGFLLYFAVCSLHFNNITAIYVGMGIAVMVVGDAARNVLARLLFVSPVDALHIFLTLGLLTFRHAVLDAFHATGHSTNPCFAA